MSSGSGVSRSMRSSPTPKDRRSSLTGWQRAFSFSSWPIESNVPSLRMRWISGCLISRSGISAASLADVSARRPAAQFAANTAHSAKSVVVVSSFRFGECAAAWDHSGPDRHFGFRLMSHRRRLNRTRLKRGVRQICGEWALTVTRPAGYIRPSSRRTSRSAAGSAPTGRVRAATGPAHAAAFQPPCHDRLACLPRRGSSRWAGRARDTGRSASSHAGIRELACTDYNKVLCRSHEDPKHSHRWCAFKTPRSVFADSSLFKIKTTICVVVRARQGEVPTRIDSAGLQPHGCRNHVCENDGNPAYNVPVNGALSCMSTRYQSIDRIGCTASLW